MVAVNEMLNSKGKSSKITKDKIRLDLDRSRKKLFEKIIYVYLFIVNISNYEKI